MAYIDPKVRARFDSLTDELKNAILQRNTDLYTLQDLIHVLEDIVNKGE